MTSAVALALLGSALFSAATDDVQVLVRTEHRPMEVDGERYRLVTPSSPLVGVVRKKGRQRVRLVVYVVRLGYAGEPAEGATPVVVTIDNERHVFPNRPRLVGERAVKGAVERREVASYPVRYPLGRLRGKSVPVRVALRRPERGGRVGVRLALETDDGHALVPIRNRLVRNKRGKRRRLPAKPPVTKPVEQPVALDAGPAIAKLEEDALVEDAGVADAGLVADAGFDAGVPKPELPPPPVIAGHVTIALHNKMPDVFVLRAVDISIDGYPIDIPLVGNAKKPTLLFDGDLKKGPHTLDVSLTYGGKGGFFFSYLDEFTFHAGDGLRFHVNQDEEIALTIEGYEGGNFITEMVDRPAVRFHSKRKRP